MIVKQITDRQHPWLKLRKALKPYEYRWSDWLRSDACFLSGREEQIIGYLFAFKGDVFCASRMLKLSQVDYLLYLKQLIRKLEGNQSTYLAWLHEAADREGVKKIKEVRHGKKRRE